jgi:excisionase family DNA binding protein
MKSLREFLSAAEAAQELGVHLDTMYGWLREKRVPYVRLGSEYRIDPDALATWIQENTVRPQAQQTTR